MILKKIIKPLLLFQICFFLASCSTIPAIKPVDVRQKTDIEDKCSRFFPETPRQFVHSIEASMPGGKKAFMIGITRIFPEKRKIHCVMMTIEGLVLFDAVYDKDLEIRRGISPFDSLDFARGLMDDIGFIFFKPDLFLEAGLLENSLKVCRYKSDLDRIIDIVINGCGNRGLNSPPCKEALPFLTMRQYRKLKLARTVNAYYNINSESSGNMDFPSELELISHTFPGYSLKLKLVETEKINHRLHRLHRLKF